MKAPIEIEKFENLLVCRMDGELTSYLIDRMKHDLVEKVAETGVCRVLVNLDGVEYVTSKDLGAFVQIFHYLGNECKADEGPKKALLAFSNLSTFVLDVIKMTRLETIFQVFETEADALKELVGNPK